MSMKDWAKNEVEIACEKEKSDGKSDEWDYGCACYESALKAYMSLLEDNHTGLSFSITKGILERLMHNKPLTPIVDEDFVEKGDLIEDSEMKTTIQCSRMISLFKKKALDGTIVYKDIDRSYCFDRDKPELTYQLGFFNKFLDTMFPITMPYYPSIKPYVMESSMFLYDSENGDFDTIALWSITTPAGNKIEINRFWKCYPSDEGFIEIDKNEWDSRFEKKIVASSEIFY